MWKKIYLIALAIALVVMAFVTYYSFSWLRSIGAPIDALNGYRRISSFGFFWLWISTAVLIVLANVVLWNYRTAWALWTTLLYVVVFLLLRGLWLDPMSFTLISVYNLPFDTSIIGPFLTLIMAAVAILLVYLNQLLVIRMRRGIYPPGFHDYSVPAEPTESEGRAEAENEKGP